MYFNYKRYHSVVIMTLVDTDYKFTWVNVGSPGPCLGVLWNDCDLRDHIVTTRIGWPQPNPLPYDDRDTPYNITGDEVFVLRTWLRKPFSKHMGHE